MTSLLGTQVSGARFSYLQARAKRSFGLGSRLTLPESSSVSDCLAGKPSPLTTSKVENTPQNRISFGRPIAGHSPFLEVSKPGTNLVHCASSPRSPDCMLLLQNGMQPAHVRPLGVVPGTLTRVRFPLALPTSPKCRESACIVLKIAGNAAIPQFFLSNRTRENLVLHSSRQLSSLFLWRADTQSGFNGSARRMQCDHKPIMGRKQLDFVFIE